MKKIIIYSWAVLFSVSLAAQDTLKLNLDQCHAMALENSKAIKIAEQNMNKAKAGKTTARSAWFPNISASATGMYSRHELQTELTLPTKTFDMTTGELKPNIAINPATGQPITGPDGNPVFNTYAFLPLDITLYGGAVAGISAQQPIYAGGKILAGNRMAGIAENLASDNKQLKEDEVIFETDKMYFTYLSVQEKYKLAKEYQDLLKAVVKTVNDSYETGMVNRNELLKVQVKYNDATLKVQKAASGLKLSRMALCRVIGLDLFSPIQIDDCISNVSFDPDHLAHGSFADREEYKLLQGQVELAQQQVKMVQGDYLPTVGVSAGYNYFNVGLENMSNYDSHGFSAIANVKIPITTFGERKGKVASAKADYTIKQLELQQAQELLMLEIEQARLNYQDAWTRIEMTRKALDQANENMKVCDDNYSLGMETVVNVLEAKAEWQKAYSDKIDALTDFKIKESNYYKVTNQLKK
ncbi:TolC family protein [Saccharicrinis sp. FJH62]|uniref:TolC family protein n=1 Tax=Saccharicrinis sp. FJH62 TaxID=3344657 RepID=UPI0035D4D98C